MLGVLPFHNVPSQGFQYDKSTTWQNLDTLQIGIETDLKYNGTGPFGKDTVRLGYDTDSTALTLNNTLVTGNDEGNYLMGLLGLSSTALHASGNPSIDSFINKLKRNGKIPSSSYGYTAGASKLTFYLISTS